MITEDLIKNTLAQVKYPGFSRDIVSFGLIQNIQINDNKVVVKMTLATRDPKIPQQIYQEAKTILETIEGIGEAQIDFDIQDPPQAQNPTGITGKPTIPGVKHIIAIASGKGGVGKSTVAANLAISLKNSGAKVGLCDCDLYGPSMALMLGTEQRPNATEDNEIIPVENHGIKFVSMGLLLDDTSPVIVRGALATRYTQQFLQQTLWGELDYLILDLPPGTGDIQLTIVQTTPLTGAIIVTTPQEVALIDARKAVSMFEKVNVPVLGIIENMSYFLCPSDGVRYDIFGSGGGENESQRLGVPLLGQIPITIETREAGDQGTPIATDSQHPTSQIFQHIAQNIQELPKTAPLAS